jgi:ABC-type nitrate/sulfonate/bicarbonate transport system ATPase subunit
MDEPFGALDPVNRARLQDLLLEVWELATPRKTIVFVTHDVDEAIYLGDRLVVLGSAPGRVIADSAGAARRDHRERRKSARQPPPAGAAGRGGSDAGAGHPAAPQGRLRPRCRLTQCEPDP